jgi:hypothetical protein
MVRRLADHVGRTDGEISGDDETPWRTSAARES